MNSGHYFCSYCNDVKLINFTERYIQCPDCQNFSCIWVLKKPVPTPVKPADAKDMFREIREGVQ